MKFNVKLVPRPHSLVMTQLDLVAKLAVLGLKQIVKPLELAIRPRFVGVLGARGNGASSLILGYLVSLEGWTVS